MALTRITGTVIEDNAITADKLGNAVITTAMIAPGAITADKLGSNTASEGPTAGEVNVVQDNVVRVGTNLIANVNTTSANVSAITDSTTDLFSKDFINCFPTPLEVNVIVLIPARTPASSL